MSRSSLFYKSVLDVKSEDDVKRIDIIGGIQRVNREPEVKVWWHLLQLDLFLEVIIASQQVTWLSFFLSILSKIFKSFI